MKNVQDKFQASDYVFPMLDRNEINYIMVYDGGVTQPSSRLHHATLQSVVLHHNILGRVVLVHSYFVQGLLCDGELCNDIHGCTLLG